MSEDAKYYTEFGQMQSDVAQLKKDCERLERKLDDQGAKLDALIVMAERGRGGLWVGMAFISIFSAVFGGSVMSVIHKWFAP